ncbi:unnamed protein product [Aureobasidium vineae]|uniref:Hsp90 chaperone protein kinase-targeting subunit n=1 Tax=Aureobasidium vineae TaxID=2773715 RepID=A0A9N8P554_9PEZI|nr:unnamed protein product [Aureobasidium vineae]
MPVDYSKWLSDDSDIEVHPNVDKRSFIRAKQNQIHQQRVDRKHQIETLKYEKIINDGLIKRIDDLLDSLQSFKQEAEQATSGFERYIFQALIKSTGSPDKDTPPPPPGGVHANVQDPPRYSKMMAALVDQAKQATKIQDLQVQLLEKLAELEKEEKAKITSETYRTGFDSSHVSKSSSQPGASKPSSTPELLNPSRPSIQHADSGQSSGADADIEDESIVTKPVASLDSDDEDMQASPLAKKFAKIRYGDYRSSLDFISNNPSVMGEKETDGLLVEAFNAQSDGNDDYARQCVHQALLLQYCRQLGRDGVQLFFKRVTTQGHQAQKLFMDDVNSTYARIRSRTRELAEQRKRDEAEGTGGVEQIQLHAVDPNTTINIVVPPAGSTDEDAKEARLQRALESGSLDKVNEVLGKMSVDEAEQVVAQLGEGGMLSLEEGVIDATTEEGRKQMEEIERSGKMPHDQEERVIEEIEDPGMD